MREGTDIAGLHHVILSRVAAGVDREIIPHQAFVIPLIEETDSFLRSVLGELSVIKAVDIVLFVGHIRIQEGLDECPGSPANVKADRVGNDLVCVVAEQSVSVVTEGDKRLVKLFLRGGLFQSEVVQPILADKCHDAVHIRKLRLDCPDRAVDGILVPVQIGLAKPVPEIRQICLVGLKVLGQINDAAHIRIGLNSGIGIGDADVRCCAGCEEVVDIIDLGPARNLLEGDLYVVLLQHLILNPECVIIVLRIRAAVVTAVIDLNRDMTGLGELAVHQL